MRKYATIILVLLAVALLFSACYAGPHQLQRTVDDWDHEMYVKSPWISAVLWIIPVIPIAKFIASIGDFFIVDAYAFWFKDAWDGKGTGFVHYQVQHTDGAMKSLLMDDGKFLQIDAGN